MQRRLSRLQPKSLRSGGRGGCIQGLLGGSWVVISRVISPLIWVIIIVTLLITTPLITTPGPPSRGFAVQSLGFTASEFTGQLLAVLLVS